MCMKPLALASVLALGACSSAVVTGPTFQPGPDGVVVVENVGGGNVLHFVGERARLERLGAPVEIRGYCNSACVVFYSLPTACMAPGSRLGFHAPSGGGPLGPSLARSRIESHLRAGVLDEYRREWGTSSEIIRVPREDVIAFDPDVMRCENGN
jgi:hypothetical protein